MDDFLKEEGPLQVAIVSINDTVAQFVYVPHAQARTPAAEELLRGLHLTTLPPTKTHSYKRLRSAMLDNMLPLRFVNVDKDV